VKLSSKSCQTVLQLGGEENDEQMPCLFNPYHSDSKFSG